MPRPSKIVKPKHNKFVVYLRHQNYEANALKRTGMPKADSMPSVALAEKYCNLLNMFIREHNQRRNKTMIELQAKLLELKAYRLMKMADLINQMSRKPNSVMFNVWDSEYKKYYALYF
jgi:hypothetical protein